MRIRISNRQRRYRVNGPRLRKLARWLMEQAPPPDMRPVLEDLTLVLSDEAGMREINRAVFGRDDSTDVISQPYAPVPPAAYPSAEVFVNVERAFRLGPRYGGPARELARYVAHGCQHLAGADDDSPAARARMHRRERAWLRRAQALDLLDDLAKDGDKPSHQ